MNARKIIQFSIGPIGGAALGLITLPFVAWFFSPEDVGRLSMLQVLLGLSVSLFSLAMHQAYVREYHEELDKEKLFKASVVPGLFLLAIVTLPVLALAPTTSEMLFGISNSFLTFLLVIGIYLNYFINFFAHVVRMQERGLAFSITQIAPKAFLLLFIVLILILDLSPVFQNLMSMSVLSLLLTVIVFMFITHETWLPAIFKKLEIKLLQRMLKFSLPLVASGLAYWGLTAMDKFFLRALSTFDQLGVYALSTTLAGAVSVVSIIFSNLWHPVVYRWAKEGIEPGKVQTVVEYMTIVVAFIWSLVGLFSWLVPYFLPAEYKSVEYLIVASVSVPLFYMLAQTTGVGIGITRRSSYAMLASFLAFLVNGLVNIILIPSFGAAGAALATVIAFYIFFVTTTEASARLWNPLPRLKIYILAMAYMLLTCLMILVEGESSYLYLVWIVLFFITLFLFRNRTICAIHIASSYLRKVG